MYVLLSHFETAQNRDLSPFYIYHMSCLLSYNRVQLSRIKMRRWEILSRCWFERRKWHPSKQDHFPSLMFIYDIQHCYFYRVDLQHNCIWYIGNKVVPRWLGHIWEPISSRHGKTQFTKSQIDIRWGCCVSIGSGSTSPFLLHNKKVGG